MKKRLITGLALRAREFNGKHRKLIPVVVFFTLILIALISFVGTIADGIRNAAILFVDCLKSISLKKKGLLAAAALILLILLLWAFVGTSDRKFEKKAGQPAETIGAVEVPSPEGEPVEEEVPDAESDAEPVEETQDKPVTDTQAEAAEDTEAKTAEETEAKIEEAAPVRSESVKEEKSASAPEAEPVEEVEAKPAKETVASQTEQTNAQPAEKTNAQQAENTKTAESEPVGASENTQSAVAKPTTEVPFDKIAEELKSVSEAYPETIGWIYFESGDISYPIMQGEDNEKYRRIDYTGQESNTGAIFLDYRSMKDFTDPNSIVYGHNMKDGSMFGAFKKYKRNPAYYEDNQYFWIITGEKKYRYRIFSYMDVPESYIGYEMVGQNSLEYVKDMEMVRRKSYIEPDIEVEGSDRIVSLSTCTRKDDLYFIMLAVLVEEE